MDNTSQLCSCGQPLNGSLASVGGVIVCGDCRKLEFELLKQLKFFRPSIDQITDNLYLGNVDASASKELLDEKKISHILVASAHLKPYFPNDYVYKTLNLEDYPDQDIKQYFAEALIFIHSAITEEKVVFVHCAAGISRSSTIVIAYLMALNSWTLKEAYQLVKSKRAIACPNVGFRAQLEQFERELKNSPFRFEGK